MKSLANLECFVRSAELGGFSAAARQLGLTPAAVSRNVAALEGSLGLRLFQRSTRKLTLTEAGERFLQSVGEPLAGLRAALAGMAGDRDEPAGTLRVSLPPSFGAEHVLPLLPDFLARYPRIRIDWRFENRAVDLVGEGFDAAIGGGIELAPGIVARSLAPAHLVAVASPDYLRGRVLPADPGGLTSFDGILMRPARSGRLRLWTMRDAAGAEMVASPVPRIVVDDPAAMRRAALLGLGVAMLVVPDVLAELQSGALVRLLPGWYADAGAISLYYAGRTLLPPKTRAFVGHVTAAFRRERLSERFAGSPG